MINIFIFVLHKWGMHVRHQWVIFICSSLMRNACSSRKNPPSFRVFYLPEYYYFRSCCHHAKVPMILENINDRCVCIDDRQYYNLRFSSESSQFKFWIITNHKSQFVYYQSTFVLFIAHKQLTYYFPNKQWIPPLPQETRDVPPVQL